MLISITAHTLTAARIDRAFTMLDAPFQVTLSPADDELTTVDINFEEVRDLSVVEAVSAVLAFLKVVEPALSWKG